MECPVAWVGPAGLFYPCFVSNNGGGGAQLFREEGFRFFTLSRLFHGSDFKSLRNINFVSMHFCCNFCHIAIVTFPWQNARYLCVGFVRLLIYKSILLFQASASCQQIPLAEKWIDPKK